MTVTVFKATPDETTLTTMRELLEVNDLLDVGAAKATEELWGRYGRAIFDMLIEQQARNALYHLALDTVGQLRRRAIGVTRRRGHGVPLGKEAPLRMVVSQGAWSARFRVESGVMKELRDLSKKDVEFRIRIDENIAREAIIRHRFWKEVLELMRTHRVDTVGGLEKKGVSLPEPEGDVADA